MHKAGKNILIWILNNLCYLGIIFIKSTQMEVFAIIKQIVENVTAQRYYQENNVALTIEK